MQTNLPLGVSVIVCCYNSAGRLLQTLECLANQRFTSPVPWEVVLVNNASTDTTEAVAAVTWNNLKAPAPLRIVHEGTPGLTYARHRGIQESGYSYLIFCDDDNWLQAGYVQTVYDIFFKNAYIAACGGNGIPAFEAPVPSWFDRFAEAYATGPQDIIFENGRILNLYGAGLAVRKNTIAELQSAGFQPVLQDRAGKSLSSAGDTELTYAINLIGGRLHYAPELQFQHFLPKERLQKTYLRKLFRAFGTDGPIRNLYYAHLTTRNPHVLLKNWYVHFLMSVFRLFWYMLKPPKANERRIYFYWSCAYISKLISLRTQYPQLLNNISKIKPTGAHKHRNTPSDLVMSISY